MSNNDELCEECGKAISKRSKANVWRGEHIVCTTCLHNLTAWEQFEKIQLANMGLNDALWFVDEMEELGPLRTDILIQLLRERKVDWSRKIWREGMTDWKPIAGMFTIPELAKDGQVRLREFHRPDRPRLL